MEWLSSDPLKAEMILWEMEKCRKYEDYIKLLDIYGNYLTTVNHQQRLDHGLIRGLKKIAILKIAI